MVKDKASISKKATQTKKPTDNKSEESSEKKQSKEIINERLFGKSYVTLKDVPPEKGLTHVKMRPNEVGNIPGMIEHWKMDLKRRRTEILKWKEQGFVQRATALLQGKKVSPEATGMEVAQLHPTKNAQDLVKKLRQDPTDMISRLELVTVIAKSGRELPIEVYRTLLLQATVACSFDELSNVGLKSALWIQDLYFSKLFFACKSEVKALEDTLKKAEAQGVENVYSMQAKQLRQYVNDIRRNMDIIKSYQKQASKALETQPMYPATVTFDEITEFMLDETEKSAANDKKRDEKRKKIIQKATEIILLIRALPLLEDQATKLGDHIKKMDPDDPTLHFLQAKIAMSDLILKVSQYQGGERTDDVRQGIQEAFKKTYSHYGIAVRKVGKMPKTKMEITICLEYGSLIHFFYKVAKHTLGIQLPKEWLAAVFKKALEVLEYVQESVHTQGLIMDIRKDMANEGLE